MSRFFHIAAALGACLSLVACSGSEDPGAAGGTAGSASPDDSTSEGFVFKGPMGAGGLITIQPLNANLDPEGDAITSQVLSEDGAYSLSVPGHQGLVELTAEGPAFNEASGAKVPEEVITLRAFGEVGTTTVLHVNLLTDLTKERLEEYLLDGMPFAEAEALVMDEFLDALTIYDDRQRPQFTGSSIDPHNGGYEAAWLLGFSSIVSEAGRAERPPESTHDDHFQTVSAMDAIRDDFADNGQLTRNTLDMLEMAETLLNPDLVTLGLKKHHEDAGTFGDHTDPVPDLHKFLDSDHDGIVNADDNCRYQPNEDQALASGGTYGVLCDTRLASISVDEQWGCGITGYDSYLGPAGSVACWEVEGAKTGGKPPEPTTHPSAAHPPWGEANPFSGMGGDQPTFTEVVVAGDRDEAPWVCAVVDGMLGDDTICWDGAGGAFAMPTPLPEALGDLTLSSDQVCGTLPAGLGTACFGRDGTAGLTLAQAYDHLTIAGDSFLCGLTDGTLECTAADGNPVPMPPPVQATTVLDFDANTAGGEPLVCAVLAGGDIECFDLASGGDPGPVAGPVGSDFVAVAVGQGTVCATDTAGKVICTREDDPSARCPEHAEPPPFAVQVDIDECHACGIDEHGFGTCWPSNWARKVGEGESIHPPD